MTAPEVSQLENIAATFKEGAARLADHLREQVALRDDLRRSADEAEAAGFPDFAAIFREMAAKLGAATVIVGKESANSRKRGRPPKVADDQLTPA